ncbi:MAG: DUF2905 domain-containing protein [Candidatus Aminicenantaceae bacterium]
MLRNLGNLLIISGVIVIIVGIILKQAVKLKGLGRLPGDIIVQKGNFTFYFPLATCLVLSLVLSLLIFIVLKIFGKS